MTNALVSQYTYLLDEIRRLECAAQRPAGSVSLLAVSKKQPIEKILTLIQLGQRHFGENQIQEALPKIAALTSYGLTWHFIGAIQSNKTRAIAENFSWVHSVCKADILERLAKQRPLHLPPLQVCIQVNLSQETQKQGISVQDIAPFIANLPPFTTLKIRGFMGMASQTSDPKEQLAQFSTLREAFDVMKSNGYDLDTLSMGMTGDYPAAILAGATWIRLGSSLFGGRT